MRIYAVLFLMFCVLAMPATTQDVTGVPAAIFERTNVYAGPSHTYPITGLLGSEIVVTILERNSIGNWLHIYREALPGTDPVEGWVMTGYVSLPEGLKFSEVPVNDSLPDAYTDGIPDADIVRIYSQPVIPEISDAMVRVFEAGQALGNQAEVVTKVGDSNSASRSYLPPIGEAAYDLGAYDFLQNAVDFYGGSFATGSLAARVGMNAFSVFDPVWSNPDKCETNEPPLLCEYRNTEPAIALIMYGPNDLKALNTDQFREQMTRVVEESLRLGVIPVLSTFSSVREEDTWFQAVRFNLILLDVAAQYEVPIINLWSPARALPRNGIGEDNVHLTAAGASVDLTGFESRYGVSLQNLLVLVTLDRIKQKLEL